MFPPVPPSFPPFSFSLCGRASFPPLLHLIPLLLNTSKKSIDDLDFTTSPMNVPLSFARTFDEFLECPLEYRHAQPIRSIEFDWLQALVDEPDKEWISAIDKPGVKIQRKWTGHGIPLLRGYMDFPGIEPDVILYNLVDFKARAEWDTFACFQNVEEGVHNSDILYFTLPTPVVKDRDFLVYRRIRGEDTPRGRGFSIMTRSTSHVSKPVLQSHIRGEIHIGGVGMHRAPGATTTQFHVASMGDPCGIVPKWLVSQYAVRKLHENIEALRTASARVQAATSTDAALRARISKVTARFKRRSSDDTGNRQI
eukprot:gnl/MRDRNA2_/MRDRNA2_70585_c0_seq1.p1 gnl/MRDRNA2_/MRDRNA2_70585_c0~~gnl/MRDRNA2_/MRDRNA2_70585_c0_seq1.p1  ORF type:complete len:333 (+),score=14.70 gnl/MRDRNA2_/MRDRNA2_70585_c0_seq1:72-1001(+)